MDAAFGHDRRDQVARSDVEGRVSYGASGRCHRVAIHFRQLLCGALFDGNVIAVGHRGIERAARGRHVERNLVVVCQDRQRVRADLVRGVAVSSDAVGADDDAIHLAAGHQPARRAVRDRVERDALLEQFPSREARALVPRPRLINPDMHRDAGGVGRVDRGGSGAVIDESQPTCIAVGQHIDR